MSTEELGEEYAVDKADHHKHMDFVQAIINRLAGNSFVMKGWALTVSSALLGFAVSRDEPLLALIALIPALVFWVLDTYYLRQERAFRAMFDDVAGKRLSSFEISPSKYATHQSWKVAWSISLSLFYGLIVALSLLVALALALTSTANNTNSDTPAQQPTCSNTSTDEQH